MYGFSTMEAPAFRMLGDMHDGRAARGRGRADHARCWRCTGARTSTCDGRSSGSAIALPPFSQRLATPPKHEWLELVKYWNAGGREPVWFVADPLRSDLALIAVPPSADALSVAVSRHDAPRRCASERDGLARDRAARLVSRRRVGDHAGNRRHRRARTGKGPGLGGISGWIRRYAEPVTLMVGGRNLAPAGARAAAGAASTATPSLDESIAAGLLPADDRRCRRLPARATTRRVTIDADNPELAIEQFDAQPHGRVVFGFGDGWNEQEYNPSTGVLWRWTSDRAAIRVRAEGHAPRADAARRDRGGVVVARDDSGPATSVAAQFDVGRTFSRTVLIPDGAARRAGDRAHDREQCVLRAGRDAVAVARSADARAQARRVLGSRPAS